MLVIEAPPRHGKSEFISKYLPAWYLGTFPDRRVILTSYEANYARSWGRKSRELLYQHGGEVFGVGVSKSQDSAIDWDIAEHTGGMQTAGVGGPITGKGADLLIIDDPIKNAEEAVSESIRDNHWDWWQSVANTRIEPGGCCIIIATRWHEDDLSGRLIKASEDGSGMPVRRLRLPAIAEEDDPIGRQEGEALWPYRWPLVKHDRLGRLRDCLEAKRLSTDLYWWLSLYQQRPGRHSRAEWPDEYFGDHIWADRWPEQFEVSVIGVDASKGKTEKSDFSAITFVGVKEGCLWIDANIERRPPERIVTDTIETHRRIRADGVALEVNGFQELLATEFNRQCIERREPPLPLHLVNNAVNKEVRIRRLGPYLLQHKIRVRDNAGGRKLVKQFGEFPLSKHDDGPDAVEMAVRTIEHLIG